MPIEKDGRSAIHSALVSRQVAAAQVEVTEKLLAGLVKSVSARVYIVPVRDTLALTRSLGWSDVPTSMVPAGNISYQVNKVGVPSKHQSRVPSCSTVASLKPSRPTHSEVIVSSTLQDTDGVFHSPLTLLKVPVVAEVSA